jgi:hypothetical protein
LRLRACLILTRRPPQRHPEVPRSCAASKDGNARIDDRYETH